MDAMEIEIFNNCLCIVIYGNFLQKITKFSVQCYKDSNCLGTIFLSVRFSLCLLRSQQYFTAACVVMSILLLPGCKNSRALGMQSGAIPNHMLAASSLSLNNYGTNYARLNGPRGWVPRYSNRNLYLIVDFGRHTIVTGISTQGRQDANQYVNGYTISVFGPETRGRYVSYKVGGIAKVKYTVNFFNITILPAR